jgi:hypothetical protein
MTTSAIYALIHKLEKDSGVWWARGGTNQLVAAMVRQFERIGGEVRLGDKVERIETLGNRVTGIHTASGWHGNFDAVASNGDIMHTYRDLLGESPVGRRRAAALKRKRFSPSLFVVHFGIEGTWPGIPHHSILFGPRYKGLLDDIFQHGVLPQDFSIYLHHPTVTDPSVAPPGMSTFYALVPVANLGKLPLDWDEIGPILEKRVLDEWAPPDPDIHSRIVTKFHYAPTDFSDDLAAFQGSAFSLEPILTQSAWFRGTTATTTSPISIWWAPARIRARDSGVVGSAKATASLMLDDLMSGDLMLNLMKRIAVYCGSASPADTRYVELAAGGPPTGRTGHRRRLWRRQAGPDGGGCRWRAGGRGRSDRGDPEALVSAEVAHTGLTRLDIVRGMHERKQAFVDLSDGFLTLPGGVGTMDELWEAISWAQLGYHAKPVGVLNAFGFYDHLLAFNAA